MCLSLGTTVLALASGNDPPESCPALPTNAPLAFTGALGYGRFANPGSNPTTYTVSSLEDYLPWNAPIANTLRWALNNQSPSGHKIVNFSVEGEIRLLEALTLSGNNITINGQSAPGTGITITGRQFGIVDAGNVCIRYLRFRSGVNPTGYHIDRSLSIFGDKEICHDICIDHCTIGPSRDDNLSVFGRVCRLTVQYSVIAGGAIGDSKSGIGSGGPGAMYDGNMTFCYNLIGNTIGRQLIFAGPGKVDFFNNVIGVWGWGPTELFSHNGEHGPRINILHNFYRSATTTHQRTSFFYDPVWARVTDDEGTFPYSFLVTTGNDNTIRVSGNKYVRQVYGQSPGTWEEPWTSDQWNYTLDDVLATPQDPYYDFPTSLKRTSNYTMPDDGTNTNSVPNMTADEAFEFVVGDSLSEPPSAIDDNPRGNAGCRLPLDTSPPIDIAALDSADGALRASMYTGVKSYPAPVPENDTYPGIANNPTPLSNATGVSVSLNVLKFYGADETDSFKVYLRVADATEFSAADIVSTPGYVTGEVSANFSVTLQPSTPYKWKVIPQNVGGKIPFEPTLIPTWYFTTGS